MERKTASEFDKDLLELFDEYVHGGISRREFLNRASVYAAGSLTAAALLESLAPNYAFAQQVPKDDSRIKTEYVKYPSPQGTGEIKGYLVKPSNATGKLPAVVVIHENRGLNPYIEDVARRLGTAGFMAIAPDGLTSLGGYPGNDDAGREMQAKLDGVKLFEDFAAAVQWVKARPDCTGKVGAVGFCYGGGVVNRLAVRIPDLAAGVPFYGNQPRVEDVPKIKTPLLIHYAGLDERINAGWPAYEAALEASQASYTTYIYDNVNHGFHNDTTPRFDKAAADLAWQRTIEHFNKYLK